MDDRFLHEMRRDPDPAFARGLRERLRRQPSPLARWMTWPRGFSPALAGALALIAIAGSFGFPAVRASAQAFLDLFRVRNFVAVSVDPERLKQLESGTLDIQALLGKQVQVLQEPGPPEIFTSVPAAAASAGFTPLVPATLPQGLVLDTVTVRHEAAARVTMDARRLRDVMEALDIRDLSVPMQLDGQAATLRMPRMVEQRFRNHGLEVHFMQSLSPEVELPPGVDLAQLGEIGLRIVGLDPGEARRFARSIDWRSTLLVPVPAVAGTFSQVEVRGHQGLLVTMTPVDASASSPNRRLDNLLLWSEGDRVYALAGNLGRVELMLMANSIQ